VDSRSCPEAIVMCGDGDRWMYIAMKSRSFIANSETAEKALRLLRAIWFYMRVSYANSVLIFSDYSSFFFLWLLCLFELNGFACTMSQSRSFPELYLPISVYRCRRSIAIPRCGNSRISRKGIRWAEPNDCLTSHSFLGCF
jgi:hypothetical protein